MVDRTKIILRSHFMSEIVTIIKISDRPSQQSHHTRVNDYSISFDLRYDLQMIISCRCGNGKRETFLNEDPDMWPLLKTIDSNCNDCARLDL